MSFDHDVTDTISLGFMITDVIALLSVCYKLATRSSRFCALKKEAHLIEGIYSDLYNSIGKFLLTEKQKETLESIMKRTEDLMGELAKRDAESHRRSSKHSMSTVKEWTTTDIDKFQRKMHINLTMLHAFNSGISK